MAYSQVTAMKVRDALGGVAVTEKRMMGGLVFLIGGNMTVATRIPKGAAEHFLFRVGRDNDDEALKIPGTRPMIHGGRRMTGFLFIDADVCDDATFDRLLTLSRDYALSLPAK